jgi:hypothetical protein
LSTRVRPSSVHKLRATSTGPQSQASSLLNFSEQQAIEFVEIEILAPEIDDRAMLILAVAMMLADPSGAPCRQW